MASGKTIKLGNLKVNFSGRGIAAKKADGDKVWRFQYPWYKSPEEKEKARYEDYEDVPESYDDEDEDEEYEEEGGVYGRYDALLDNKWLLWLLLIVLPPVGVWLLWRQKRYDITTRTVISGAAVIWFIILLILLFSRLGRGGDTITPIATRAPTSLTGAVATDTSSGSSGGSSTAGGSGTIGGSGTAGGSGAGGASGTASGTATGSGSDGTGWDGDSGQTGSGTDGSGAAATPVIAAGPTPLTGTAATPAPTEAPEVEATPAPTEVPTEENTYVYCTSGGRNYHAYATCSGMRNAARVPVSVAKSMHKTPCDVCLQADGLTPINASSSSDGAGTGDDGEEDNPALNAQATPRPAATAQAGGPFYATQGGTYYHKDPTCSGMQGAHSITAARAVALGKKPCPTCVGNVYATATGKYYHKTYNCSGMQGAKLITVAAAKRRGQTACPVCLGGTGGGVVYYATATGKYYHVLANCSGMMNAAQTTVATAKKRGQAPCPVCIGDKTTTYYYATKHGKYYHTNRYCSNMANAEQVTLAVAQSQGKTACPVCVKSAANATQQTTGTKYYSTTNGKYYHKTATCSGMQNAQEVTLPVINQRGQTACPVCLGTVASYYSTADGKYYHKTASCSGMQNADRVSYATARQRGQTACPVCLGGAGTTNNAATAQHYYATRHGKYYHKTATCSGMQNATKVTLAQAQGNGQTACPVCLGGVASYYSTPGGKYYHKTATCSGMQGADRVSYATAVKRGQTACPVCLGGTAKATTTTAKYYYATKNGRYYHTNATCSGMRNASKVSLAQAKAHGQTACPVCAGGKKTTATSKTKTTASNSNVSVWIARDMQYHSRQYCSGNQDAVVTTLGYAVKKGYQPCQVCNPPTLKK